MYKVQDGDVILSSYGKDGSPGGLGENADLIAKYAPKDANGQWKDFLDFDETSWPQPHFPAATQNG